MKRMLLSLLVTFAGLGPVSAAPLTFTVTVDAGKQDRVNTPICVPLYLAGELDRVEVALLTDANGKTFPGQLTRPSLSNEQKPRPAAALPRELHFILPSLKADQTATFKVTVSTDPVALVDAFSWHDKPGESAELRYGARPVLRYMYKALAESSKESRDETFKVYHHLFDPSGKRLVTKGPGGQYTHHRGLFYGFKCSYGDKKTADTWHCPPGTHLAHEKFLVSEAGPVLGRHRVQIGWHGPGKERFAVEERELTVYNLPGGPLVEFASKLTSTVGSLTVGGDPQHAGFHFRADNEVSAKTKGQTYYLRPDGKDRPGATRNWPKDKEHVNLPWNAMSFVLGEQRYTAAYLDRPTNPKEARFSERDYGRFGSYFEHTLEDKKPLVVNYRLWLREGEMTGAQVGALSADFVTPPAVTVK
jgi:hypothetical protein